MFDLHITDTNVSTGSIPVSWCIKPDAIKDLTEKFGPDPAVVLIVAPTENYHISKEVRKIVPLRDLMAYLDFKVAGTNKIWAFISQHNAKKASSLYLDKEHGVFTSMLLEADGKGWGWRFRQDIPVEVEPAPETEVVQNEAEEQDSDDDRDTPVDIDIEFDEEEVLDESDSESEDEEDDLSDDEDQDYDDEDDDVDDEEDDSDEPEEEDGPRVTYKTIYEPKAWSVVEVSVPREAFAPEPAEWEKKWVNHFFSKKPVDQCHFRRRRMFAYTVQPVLMTLQILVRFVITLVALMIGFRNFSLKPLLHPMTYSMEMQLEVLFGGSIFIRRLPEPPADASAFQVVSYGVRSLCLLPLMPPILAFLVICLVLNPIKFLTVSAMVLVIGALLLGIVILIAGGTIKSWVERWESRPRQQESISDEELEYLTCSPNKGPLTIDNMPAKKKTIKLRFLDIKSRICRPFSQ